MRFPSQSRISTDGESIPSLEHPSSYSRHSGVDSSCLANINGDATGIASSSSLGTVEIYPEPCSRSSHSDGGGRIVGGTCTRRRRQQLDPRFEVRRDPACPQRGRGVFAIEAVPAGTEVMVARQAAGLPRDRYRAAFCRCCLNLLDKAALIKCQRCEDRFCGKECVIAAAREGTHETTCSYVEGLGDGCFDSPGARDSAAATEREILRLTIECLARRRAGLSDEEEWAEIEDLDLGAGATDDEDPGVDGGMLDVAAIREAQARLNRKGYEVPAREIQMVHRR